MSVYVKLIRSPRKSKKFRMEFYIKEKEIYQKILHQDFGAIKKDGTPYSDYTIHKDPKRKKNYIARHIKLPNFDKFYEPAGLSRYLLWNKPTLAESFKDYLKTFDLKPLPP